MGSVTCHRLISLDGFVAGPNQSVANPIVEGGMQLHQWMFETNQWRAQHGQEGGGHSADSEVVDEVFNNVGAYIMGRKMFGGGAGPWDKSWRGWWGEDPPYHVPVFVLSHHQREPLPMQGGTTFRFVTDGIESADELYLHISPVILGAGARLLEDVGDPNLEIVKVVASPIVTHIKYRIVR